MITLGKFFSSTLNTIGQRLVKSFIMNGTATAEQVAPFGDDSVPLRGMDVIYAETESDEQPVIIGCMNLNLMAGPGEKRMFAMKLNDDGKTYSEVFYTWMKADGTFEIGGDIDNAVRYAKLNEGLQAQITKMQTQLGLIAAAIAVAGGSYTPGDITLDISGAKINEIKTL